MKVERKAVFWNHLGEGIPVEVRRVGKEGLFVKES